jgi:hypothetical protein
MNPSNSLKDHILLGESINIKWYLIKNRNHYYQVTLSNQSELKIKSDGELLAKRFLTESEESRIWQLLNNLKVRLPFKDGLMHICPNIQHKLDINSGELSFSIAWSSIDESHCESAFKSIRMLTDFIESLEQVHFGFMFL